MATFAPVTHIIFDLDGLLLDSEIIYKDGLNAVLKKFDKVYTDDLRLKVMGTKEPDTCRIIIEELKLPVVYEEFFEEYILYFKTALRDVDLMPGAERLIRHFHKNGIPMAVATSSGKETCNVKLGKYPELRSCFSHIVMGSSDSEVAQGKPAPDIFFVAANRFPDTPSPEKCLVFEDSYNGVLAAKAANMQVVMVPETLVPEEKRKVATVVYESLNDFVPEIFGLPPYDI